jgi:hypothetical protein
MNGRSALTRAGDCGLSAKNTSAKNVTPCVAPSRAVHMARTFSRTDRASFFLLKGNPLEDISQTQNIVIYSEKVRRVNGITLTCSKARDTGRRESYDRGLAPLQRKPNDQAMSKSVEQKPEILLRLPSLTARTLFEARSS